MKFSRPQSLKARVEAGIVVPLKIDAHENVSLTVFAPLEVVGAGNAKVEVDTGRDCPIGDDYLRHFVVTFDLSRSLMILQPQ